MFPCGVCKQVICICQYPMQQMGWQPVQSYGFEQKLPAGAESPAYLPQYLQQQQQRQTTSGMPFFGNNCAMPMSCLPPFMQQQSAWAAACETCDGSPPNFMQPIYGQNTMFPGCVPTIANIGCGNPFNPTPFPACNPFMPFQPQSPVRSSPPAAKEKKSARKSRRSRSRDAEEKKMQEEQLSMRSPVQVPAPYSTPLASPQYSQTMMGSPQRSAWLQSPLG